MVLYASDIRSGFLMKERRIWGIKKSQGGSVEDDLWLIFCRDDVKAKRNANMRDSISFQFQITCTTMYCIVY